jgi:hypothetical protein
MILKLLIPLIPLSIFGYMLWENYKKKRDAERARKEAFDYLKNLIDPNNRVGLRGTTHTLKCIGSVENVYNGDYYTVECEININTDNKTFRHPFRGVKTYYGNDIHTITSNITNKVGGGFFGPSTFTYNSISGVKLTFHNFDTEIKPIRSVTPRKMDVRHQFVG